MERKSQERTRSVWKPLCLLFAALLTLSWVFFGMLYSNGNVRFSTLENPEQNYTADGGAIVGESTGNGAQIMSVQIPAENYAEYGISLMAESAYQLTATITPGNAGNKAVDWSVSFVNPDSEWAAGKTVTDYVTVTPTSDGALTANVECLQDFGEQIKVVVTSRDNPSAKAECIVDYAQRIDYIEIVTDLFTISSKDVGQAYTVNARSLSFEDVIYHFYDYTVADTALYDTVGGNDRLFDISGTPEFEEILDDFEDISSSDISVGTVSVVAGTSLPVSFSTSVFTQSSGTLYDCTSRVDDDTDVSDAVSNWAAKHIDEAPFARLTFERDGLYSDFSFSCDFYGVAESFAINVSSVLLDPTIVTV